jgi:hypothetical protein
MNCRPSLRDGILKLWRLTQTPYNYCYKFQPENFKSRAQLPEVRHLA